MSWPVIVYITAPVGSLIVFVLTALYVWRRVRSLMRDVQDTAGRAAAAGEQAAALSARLDTAALDALPTG